MIKNAIGLSSIVLALSIGIFGSSCKNWNNVRTRWNNGTEWLLMPDDVDNLFKVGEDSQLSTPSGAQTNILPPGSEYAASSNILVPLVNYSTLDGTPNAGEQVNYDAQILAGPSPLFLTFRWNFGDGSTPMDGQNATHTYSAKGTYTVTLIVRNDFHNPPVAKLVRKDIVISE